jgi:CheY-like chemotaxis protein
MSGGGRNSATGYLQTAQLVGAQHVLAKPFTHEELEVTLASALAGK